MLRIKAISFPFYFQNKAKLAKTALTLNKGNLHTLKSSLYLISFQQMQFNLYVKIRVGNNIITQKKSTKLLGMIIEESQSWKDHFFG